MLKKEAEQSTVREELEIRAVNPANYYSLLWYWNVGDKKEPPEN